ncbi:MAG: DNA polymerase I, partial [Acidobacteriota bacterium]|nr:DNA polymerase I [Acidobacteriota bacterium]
KGDSVDNVPGVPGIGEKGALTLIKEFGDLETLLERASEVKRKSYREGLTDHRDKAELSKELVTIHTDLPVDFEPDRLALEPPDTEALREIYRELEFFSLLKEVEAGIGKGAQKGPETEPAIEATTVTAWKKSISGLGGKLFVGVVGGASDDSGEGPMGLVVAGESGCAVYCDFRHKGLEAAAIASLEVWLANSDVELAGHDLKEVLRLSPEIAVEAGLFDTMLVSYLLHSAARSHTLEAIALERLGVKPVAAKEAGWDKGHVPPPGHEPLLLYAAEHVEIPRSLAGPLRSDLAADKLEAVYREIEAPLVPVLVAMEEKGISLDVDFLSELSQQLGGELAALEEEVYKIAGDPFNIQSPRQLGEIMFERLGYPVIKKTRKTKSYSTDSATLEELATRGYELPEKILAYRELAKLKSTYVDALPALVADDGRLHTRFHQAVAATGRLSSASPNLQNIPVRTERGQEIRKAFVAPRGRRLLVADYNQIELRVLAHIAEEPELIEAFRAGKDIHASTAAAVLGVAEELVTGEQRRAAKVINFGIMYGMSAFGLAQNLKISKAEAEKFISAYLDRYAGVKRYMDETIESVTREGKVATLYGRLRWLPDIQSRNYNLRENAKRMAINARIQGTAADLLKMAMIAVHHRLRKEHPESALLLTVHDELVIECPTDQVDAVGELVVTEMSEVEKLEVPLAIDVGSGKSWYEAKS